MNASVPTLLTFAETCAVLRVSGTTLRNIVAAGKLACHQIGAGRGKRMFKQVDVAGYIEASRKVPVTPARRPPVAFRRVVTGKWFG